MVTWVFIILLCCPFNSEHEIAWRADTQEACVKMRKALVKEIKGFGVRASVGECMEDVSGR